MLTYRLLGAIKVVLDIRTYDWGSLSYGFFITFLRRAFSAGLQELRGLLVDSDVVDLPCVHSILAFLQRYILGHMASPFA